MELNGYTTTDIGVLPHNWDVKPLSELTVLMTNGFVGTAKSHYTNSGEGVVYIQGYNVKENSFNFHGIKRVTEDFHKKHKKSNLKEGDLLTVQTGDIGLTTFVTKELEGANCHALIISRFNKNTAYSKFFSFYLNSHKGRSRLREIETGSTMKHINVGDMVHFLVPLPPLPEQKAIAEVLSDTDSLIQSLEKQIEKNRMIKQGAMQKLLSPKEGWEEMSLPNVCWFQEGPGVRKHQFTSNGVKLLNGTNIEKGRLLLDKTDRYISANEAYGWYSHFLVNTNDILIACSGVSIDKFHEKVTIAKDHDLPLCMNTSTMRFRPTSNKLIREYLFHFLKSDNFKVQIGGQATGSAQLNFGPSHVSKVKIPLPPEDEQSKISSKLSDIDLKIESLETKLGKYISLKKGLMQNLLTGRIRIK